MGRIATALRDKGIIPLDWIVDNVRSTLKPSSWSDLEDFWETVAEAYRKDFWRGQRDYVCVIIEKDARAGTIQPVTERFDVALHVIRGYSSISYAAEIGRQWAAIRKPIYAYVAGDFDPSGLDLERSFRDRLAKYSGREFAWRRLAIVPEDFESFGLVKLPVKRSDSRAPGFVKAHGTDCAERPRL